MKLIVICFVSLFFLVLCTHKQKKSSTSKIEPVSLICNADEDRIKLESFTCMSRKFETPKETLPKVVWSFWDVGASKMPAFYKFNVSNWRKKLGPDWNFIIVSLKKDDPCYYKKFISDKNLPKNFHTLDKLISSDEKTIKPVVQSDHIRLELLRKYGGYGWILVTLLLNI